MSKEERQTILKGLLFLHGEKKVREIIGELDEVLQKKSKYNEAMLSDECFHVASLIDKQIWAERVEIEDTESFIKDAKFICISAITSTLALKRGGIYNKEGRIIDEKAHTAIFIEVSNTKI